MKLWTSSNSQAKTFVEIWKDAICWTTWLHHSLISFFRVPSEIWNKSCSLVIGGVSLIISVMSVRWDLQLSSSGRHEIMQRFCPWWWQGGLQSFLIFLWSQKCNYFTQFRLGWCILCTIMDLCLCSVLPQCSLPYLCLVHLWSFIYSVSHGVISIVWDSWTTTPWKTFVINCQEFTVKPEMETSRRNQKHMETHIRTVLSSKIVWIHQCPGAVWIQDCFQYPDAWIPSASHFLLNDAKHFAIVVTRLHWHFLKWHGEYSTTSSNVLTHRCIAEGVMQLKHRWLEFAIPSFFHQAPGPRCFHSLCRHQKKLFNCQKERDKNDKLLK